MSDVHELRGPRARVPNLMPLHKGSLAETSQVLQAVTAPRRDDSSSCPNAILFRPARPNPYDPVRVSGRGSLAHAFTSCSTQPTETSGRAARSHIRILQAINNSADRINPHQRLGDREGLAHLTRGSVIEIARIVEVEGALSSSQERDDPTRYGAHRWRSRRDDNLIIRGRRRGGSVMAPDHRVGRGGRRDRDRIQDQAAGRGGQRPPRPRKRRRAKSARR